LNRAQQPPIESLANTQRSFFLTGTTRDAAWRIRRLRRLDEQIAAWTDRIIRAVSMDVKKPPIETFVSEIAIVRSEIRHTVRHLGAWTGPRKARSPLISRPSKAWVAREPYGVSLIIGPWNYPFGLIMHPLVGSIAAGNCAIVKPSELAPATSALVTELLRETFEPDHVASVEGDADTVRTLIQASIDHIFFTGSTETGKKILSLAAPHCIPAVLELGGKNPCIVDETAVIGPAAKRIARAKFFNAGQTCIAPDFVAVQRPVLRLLIDELRKAIERFYGENPAKSPDFGRIATEEGFKRLAGLLVNRSVACGGSINGSDRYIAPTVLEIDSWDDPLLKAEIFGPILPLLPFDDIDEVLGRFKKVETPLALYAFTNNKSTRKRLLNETRSGSISFNDVMNQAASPRIPFGGQKESGMGQYHGREGVYAFSRPRIIIDRSARWDCLPQVYPPYGDSLKKLKKIGHLLVR
jgi:aldehyde dehydrogenase (NAD+)